MIHNQADNNVIFAGLKNDKRYDGSVTYMRMYVQKTDMMWHGT